MSIVPYLNLFFMQIRKLQAILEAREDEERQKNDTQEIIPIVMNGKQDSSPLESPRSKVFEFKIGSDKTV